MPEQDNRNLTSEERRQLEALKAKAAGNQGELPTAQAETIISRDREPRTLPKGDFVSGSKNGQEGVSGLAAPDAQVPLKSVMEGEVIANSLTGADEDAFYQNSLTNGVYMDPS